MGDIKLFRTDGATVTQLEGRSVALEKSLQTQVENNLDAFLGVTFLDREYSTGKRHGGRIDTLGIDENGCPVIIEYKRSSNENVINQGLFYLDWLMDHKGEFELLVLKKCGDEWAECIEWSSPRLLCIAGAFTKYDEHAVQQINRNIELLRYLRFGEELLLFELVNSVQATSPTGIAGASNDGLKGGKVERTAIPLKTVADQLSQIGKELSDLYDSLEATLLELGDDVQMKTLKAYFAFKRIKNFASVNVRSNYLLVWVKVDPDTIELDDGFTRDVRGLGHRGTGDLEITIRNQSDIERALPLFEKSYEAS